ncbi:MAG: PspC domain-containing protein [Cypionkella sp.]
MSDPRRPVPAVRPAKPGFALDRQNAKLAGVCAGIARHFGIDPLIVRIGFVAGTILGFGSLILVYLAIALIAD